MTSDSDSLEMQAIGLRPRVVSFIKHHGRIAEWFRRDAQYRYSVKLTPTLVTTLVRIGLAFTALTAIVGTMTNDGIYLKLLMIPIPTLILLLIFDVNEGPLFHNHWFLSILGGIGPGMIDDVASVSVSHPILGDCMLTWSTYNTTPDSIDNDYEYMRKLFVQGIGRAWFYSHMDSTNISDNELTDWLRGAVYNAWMSPDAWRDGRITIHDSEDTGDANESIIKQCLMLITSVTARADTLGLTVSDELTPIREALREHANRNEDQTVEVVTVARKNPLTWFDHHASAGSGNDTLSESIGNNIDMDRMIVSLDHAVTVSIPSEYELENDVLPRLRSIDARLEAMSRDTATVRDAAITLSSLDTHLEQVAVAASAR